MFETSEANHALAIDKLNSKHTDDKLHMQTEMNKRFEAAAKCAHADALVSLDSSSPPK